ncbi:MAG TPA: CDP-alcohol phosphatidyltransferase family protein [Anaerolineae bacterium]|nr:CDP-alcohol phosphatidyltransferase family protein [Anaerolineae bacterium]
MTTAERYCLTAFLADALTLARLSIGAAILWLGWMVGRAALPQAILLATAGWITDGVDGFIARHSHCKTRLGWIDFPVDVALTWAALLFLVMAGFLSLAPTVIYTLLAILGTLWFRKKAVLILFMRGIDLTAFFFAVRYALTYTLPLLAWLALLAWLHRQRLRRDVPRWLRELANLFSHPFHRDP